MAVQMNAVLGAVAREMHVSEDDLLKQGMRAVLERQLRQVKAQLFEITGHYGVSSVEAMEARYREGSLDESDSWRDLQRLDHLEFERERLVKLLETIA